MAHSARHRHTTTTSENTKLHPGGGLFSNVFSFVSREIESFVLNATGAQAKTDQCISTGRVRSSGRRRHDGDAKERNMSDDEARHRSRGHHDHGRKRRSKTDDRRKPRSKSTDSTRKRPHRHIPPTYVDDADEELSAIDREQSTSPPPQPTPVCVPQDAPTRPLKKQPSITMPGSLFPRSSSLEPEEPDGDRRAHFLFDVPSPAHPSRLPLGATEDEGEAGPSRTNASADPSAECADPYQIYMDQYVSPWRTRSVSSVKDAVQRFNTTEGAEADFSLLLPSPHSSPVKGVARPHSDAEASQKTSSDSTARTTASRKGKERARDDETDYDLAFIVGETSGRVHAKERELDVAREEQREHQRRLSGDHNGQATSGERERDKQRIKALEEEVRRLKEELSRSQRRSPVPPPCSASPPPPPPPPPPPFPLRIDTTPCTPTFMFATARASLRHTTTPVEAPINPGIVRTRRKGQPTVNVPSDKMAAFLNEMKTVKLRKVGLGTDTLGSESAGGPSGLSKSVSGTSSTGSTGPVRPVARELLRRRSLANLRVPIGSSLAAPVPPSALALSDEPVVRVGQKRKVDALGVDELTDALHTAKRRSTQPSSQSSSGSTSSSGNSGALPSLSSLTVPPFDPTLPSRTWPANETDITTPSLCSDNDRDGENSIEDRAPSTPPGPRTIGTGKDPNTDLRARRIEVTDIDMEDPPHTEPGTIHLNSVPRRASDLFKKRPPTSPIPIPSPRKPKAPARTKRGATPKPKSAPPPTSDEDDENGARPPPTPVPFLSLIPVSRSKTKTKRNSTASGRTRALSTSSEQKPSNSSIRSAPGSQPKPKQAHKRRPTLDEELRTAEARTSDIDQGDDELRPEQGDDDVFVGTGTRSKRKGFLAHGGGGGVPMFMGMGYVQGAVEDSTDEGQKDGTAEALPRKLHKSASQGSLLPRLKARS